MWINRHELNNSLIVFIHGIFGGRWTSWSNYVDFFQQFPDETPLLSSFDVYLFEYPTPRLRQPPISPNILDRLRRFLQSEDVREKYQTIVFVCHSQGGIVGKLFLVEELDAGRGLELKVDLIITLCTPHLGSLLLNSAWLLSNVPVLKQRAYFRQLGQLGSWSETIRKLRSKWGEPLVTRDANCKPEATRRYIRSVAITGLKDHFVSNQSAEGFAVDIKDDQMTGHSVNSLHVIDYLGRIYLREHARPTALVTEAKKLSKDFTRHAGTVCPLVAEIVQGKRPHAADYERYRPYCLAADFADAIESRPVRKLSLEDAFVRYARISLS